MQSSEPRLSLAHENGEQPVLGQHLGIAGCQRQSTPVFLTCGREVENPLSYVGQRQMSSSEIARYGDRATPIRLCFIEVVADTRSLRIIFSEINECIRTVRIGHRVIGIQ